MRLHDALEVRDRLRLCMMWFVTILVSGFISYEKQLGVTSFFTTVFISILYFICCSHAICHDFIIEERKQKIHGVVRRAFYGYIGGLILCTALYFLPVSLHAMLAVSAMLCVLLPLHYGIFLAIGIGIVLAINFNLPNTELIYLMFSCLIGALISRYIGNRKYMIHSSIIMVSLNVSMYFIGCYASHVAITADTVVYACGEGIINVLVAMIFIPFLVEEAKHEITIEYAKTLELDFPLVGFIYSLSKKRYEQCRIVSNICYNCAKLIGANEELACCAGFYYSFCDNDEPEPIKYAVNLLNQNHVPIEVVRIVAEYHGTDKSISTVEAAIVDLVEASISAYYFEKDKPDFHLEIFIHSLFNDLSCSGRYDSCGLGMNQFLNIRDEVIHEVLTL